MGADDIRDLFDREEADESDGSTGDERSDESDGSAAAEFPPLEGEGSVEPADPAREEAAEPTTTPSEGAGDDDFSEFEPAVSTSTEGAAGDETDGSEVARSTKTSSEEGTEDDRREFESPTPTSSEGAIGGEADGSESAAATASAGETGEDDTGESGSAAAAVSPEGATGEERNESESSGATAAADGTSAGDRNTPTSGGVTTTTDGPPAIDHDEFDTARPESIASATAAGGGATAPASASNRLPTGIDELDRAMGGGIPPGRLVLFVADPGVQSELIVDSVLAQRDTLFVTTDRPDWEVMKDIEPGLGSGEVMIREHNPDSLLSGIDSLLDQLGTSSNLVLDSVNELELVPRQRYRIFLSDVKRRLFDTGSIGLLTGVTVGHESARDLTLRRADIVWRLETRTRDRAIENLLSVPKFRGGAAMTETVKLELTDEVKVDTNWHDG